MVLAVHSRTKWLWQPQKLHKAATPTPPYYMSVSKLDKSVGLRSGLPVAYNTFRVHFHSSRTTESVSAVVRVVYMRNARMLT